MQYTIRKIPAALDVELRERARREAKSLNQVVVEALAAGAGLGPSIVRYRELGDLAGTWQEDPAFDAAVADQDSVDDTLWR